MLLCNADFGGGLCMCVCMGRGLKVVNEGFVCDDL